MSRESWGQGLGKKGGLEMLTEGNKQKEYKINYQTKKFPVETIVTKKKKKTTEKFSHLGTAGKPGKKVKCHLFNAYFNSQKRKWSSPVTRKRWKN